MKTLRIALWALVAIAAIGFGAMLLMKPKAEAPAERMAMQPVGGPFTLLGPDGQPFSSQRLAGKPQAVFFGFTHCPDVCPTTLARLAKLRKQLGKGDDAFQIVFISVDPERDTPAEMARYAGLFGTPVVALTGSIDQVERVKKQYGVFSEKSPLPNGDYTVDHSAAVFLLGSDGGFLGTIAPDEGDAVALEKVRRLAS